MPAGRGDRDLFLRFGELGRLGRLTLDCMANGEWEVRALNLRKDQEDFIISGDNMLDVVLRAINRAEELGWFESDVSSEARKG